MIDQLVVEATPDQPRQCEASMVELRDGSLLVGYSDFYGGSELDEGPARLMAKRSADGGRTWSEPELLQENIGRTNTMEASFCRLASGDLLLAFLCKHVQWVEMQVMVKRSSDEGKSWSEPRPITHGEHYWCGTNDRLVQLVSGRLLYPLAVRRDGLSVATCFFSDDDGETWQQSLAPTKMADSEVAEPVVVPLEDDHVLMLLRNTTGWLYASHSYDGGMRWQVPQRLALTSPPAPCNCRRLPNGDLLLVWNNHSSVRMPLTAAISPDGGRNWRHIRNLEEWSVCGLDTPLWSGCYPSILLASDERTVHVTYWYTGRDVLPDGSWSPRLFHLKQRTLPLAWFYGEG